MTATATSQASSLACAANGAALALVLVHRGGGGVGDRARGGELRRHPAELVLRELVVDQRLAELLAVDDVLGGLLERGLRHAAGAAAGLQAAGGEAAHLQVEALADAVLAADDVLGGHEAALEGERERVHAAVARRRVGLAREPAAAGLLDVELVTERARLRHDEQRQPACALRHVGIGAREQREDVGASRERAPRLRAR